MYKLLSINEQFEEAIVYLILHAGHKAARMSIRRSWGWVYPTIDVHVQTVLK